MLKFQFAKLDSEGAGNVIMSDVVLDIMAAYCLEFHLLSVDKKDLIKKKDIKLKKYYDSTTAVMCEFPVKRTIFEGKEFTLTCHMHLPHAVGSHSPSVNNDRAFISFYITPTKSTHPESLFLLTLDKDLDYAPISTVVYGMSNGKCITSERAPSDVNVHYFSLELYNGIAGKYKGARKELLKNIQDVL